MPGFQIDHPDLPTRMQEVLAAAMEIRDRPGPVEVGEILDVLRSAGSLPPLVQFRVAQALIRRHDQTEVNKVREVVIDLAANVSSDPSVFRDTAMREKLFKAIRNLSFDAQALPGVIPGSDDEDRGDWMKRIEYSKEWGISPALFATGTTSEHPIESQT